MSAGNNHFVKLDACFHSSWVAGEARVEGLRENGTHTSCLRGGINARLSALTWRAASRSQGRYSDFGTPEADAIPSSRQRNGRLAVPGSEYRRTDPGHGPCSILTGGV